MIITSGGSGHMNNGMGREVGTEGIVHGKKFQGVSVYTLNLSRRTVTMSSQLVFYKEMINS